MDALHEELLNLYDAQGRVLMQRRPADKENGGLWDKSVGGHVSAGEEWDQTLVREAGEELFDDPRSAAVRLASSPAEFARLQGELDLGQGVLLRRATLQLNLRDVRRVPGGGYRNVLYHVAIYLGRTALPLEGFRPQAAEIDALEYQSPADIDRLLLQGQLAPNMAFLWLTHAQELLRGAPA